MWYLTNGSNCTRPQSRNKLYGYSGTEQAHDSVESSLMGVRQSMAELARVMQVEIDRIYGALRAVNTQADSAASQAQSNAVASGLWEYVDGELVPKDPDA